MARGPARRPEDSPRPRHCRRVASITVRCQGRHPPAHRGLRTGGRLPDRARARHHLRHPGVGLPDRGPGHATTASSPSTTAATAGARCRRAAQRYGLDFLAADLDAVLEATLAPGERAVIAGHSMGGIAITSWAERYPERVPQRADAVALINTTTGDLLRHVQLLPVPAPAGRRAGACGGDPAEDVRRGAASASGGSAEPAVRLDDRGGPRRRPGDRRIHLRVVHLDTARRPRRLGPHAGRRARRRAHRADRT